MKTNVSIDLTDAERKELKAKIDGKPSSKMLSRAEVKEMCQGLFDGLKAAELLDSEDAPSPGKTAEVVSIYDHPWYQIAPEDAEAIERNTKGRSEAYVLSYTYGYNKARKKPRAS